MGKKKIMLILIIIIALSIISLYGTFAMINNQATNNEDIDYAFVIGQNTNQEIIISPKMTKTFDITIENPYEGTLKYAIVYTTKNNTDIEIGVLNTSENPAQGTIESLTTKKISLIVNNTTDSTETMNISVVIGYINGGYLILQENQTLITKTIDIGSILNTNLDESGANAPNLTEGMIPIYYELEDKSWHKADSSNTNENYQWYDYNNKMWANVALVTQESLKEYQDLSVGEIINQEDVLAYLVWIPRFKYQVWDIENTLDETKYYYAALKDGINITFETSTNTTGNITCDNTNCTGENGQEYTHPAFNFGGKELTGFWIGKFETTGSKDTPTILPNYNALTFLNIKEEHETARLLTTTQTYNLNETGLDSHVIKSLEWSAVSYLTNSTYGICNGARNGCRNIYKNNSLYFNTGSSSAGLAENSNFGSYSYLGEKLDAYGLPTEETTKQLASTTGNVYGVYDMVGGAYETVMMTTKSENSYLKEIDTKYYTVLKEKSLLGEISYGNNEEKTTDEEIWYANGGTSQDENPTIFSFQPYNGESQSDVSFRIVIT